MELRVHELRKRQTDAEKKLWFFLRNRQLNGAKFRRQHPISFYIVDFCCIEKKIIIEIDGSQHKLNAQEDKIRTDFLTAQGYHVIRFWNHEVLTQLEAVLEQIRLHLNNPHPSPLPEGEGDKKVPFAAGIS